MTYSTTTGVTDFSLIFEDFGGATLRSLTPHEPWLRDGIDVDTVSLFCTSMVASDANHMFKSEEMLGTADSLCSYVPAHRKEKKMRQ